MMGENFSLLPGVLLADEVIDKVKTLADQYHQLTNKTIVVTSGIRTAQSQALAMYEKLAAGDDLEIYRDREAAMEIKQAYDIGVSNRETREKIITDMERVIASQLEQGTYISQHLRHGAVDIRSRDMSDAEKELFMQVAQGIAKTIILEAKPPHFHLQF